MKKIIANVYTQGPQEDTTEFEKIISLLESEGYEIAWSNYPTNAVIIEEIQNEGE